MVLLNGQIQQIVLAIFFKVESRYTLDCVGVSKEIQLAGDIFVFKWFIPLCALDPGEKRFQVFRQVNASTTVSSKLPMKLDISEMKIVSEKCQQKVSHIGKFCSNAIFSAKSWV